MEPIRGLPEPLPADEQILWQGAPGWGALCRRAFHINVLAVYFAALVVWYVASLSASGTAAARAVLPFLLLALAAVSLVTAFAWLISRTTVYTITSRRVVMHVGIALTMTFNVPLRMIEAAALRTYSDGSGNIRLTLAADQHLAYLALWPHVRPWRFGHAEPMLRSVPDAARVAETLAQALAGNTVAAVQAAPALKEVAVAVSSGSRTRAAAAA